MKKYLVLIVLLVGLNLSANEKIFRMIPNDCNSLASVNFEEIFKKELKFLMELAQEADEEKFLEKFKKSGLEPKLLKQLYFASGVENNMNKQAGHWNWLTFVEFTQDIELGKILNSMKSEFELDILEGKIGDKKSYEVNNGVQDIFLIQLNPRLVVLGSKESLEQSLKISQMGKEENLQFSVLGNDKLMDLVATAEKHQVWITAELKNKKSLLNLSDFIVSFDFDKDLKFGAILNFWDAMSCDQAYQFWPMVKGFIMDKPLFLENKHFYDTKFDQSILLKITFPKAALRRAGVMDKKKEKENEQKDLENK